MLKMKNTLTFYLTLMLNFVNTFPLFPKCFSSFLHSTCSLSVSHIYLALEEIHLPLWAAIQTIQNIYPLIADCFY